MTGVKSTRLARDSGDSSMASAARSRKRQEVAGNSVFPAGFDYYPSMLGDARQKALAEAIEAIVASAPLYRPAMPRTGKPFSITMTNCGPLGWVSDKDGGYRYQAHHPLTGNPWPAMPPHLTELWAELAGYPAPPQACLINHYTAGTKLGSHVDADEEDFDAPVISISLGDDAIFHIGGTTRSAPKQRLLLHSGDVVVLGGASRRAYHGLDRLHPDTSDVVPWGGRVNLTLRRVTKPQAQPTAPEHTDTSDAAS